MSLYSSADSLFTLSLEIALACGFLALFLAAVFRILLGLKPAGTERMELWSRAQWSLLGAALRVTAFPLVAFSAGLAVLIYLFLDTGWGGVQTGAWAEPLGAGLFLVGVLSALLMGTLTARAGLLGAARTVQAARTSLSQSVQVAFLGSAFGGFLLMGFAIVPSAGGFLLLLQRGFSLEETLSLLLIFAAGVSITAFVLRLGASSVSIAATAARPALSGATPEEYVQVDGAQQSGTFLSSTAGRSATTLALFLTALFTAMMFGLETKLGSPGEDVPVLLPLFVACIGILASAFSSLLVRVRKGQENVTPALRAPAVSAAVMVGVGTYALGFALLDPREALSLALSAAAGLLPIIFQNLFGGTLEEEHDPRDLSAVMHGGPNLSLLFGIVWGVRGMLFPLFLTLFALILGGMILGPYGIALAAVSALAVSSTNVSAQFFRTLAEQAEDIAKRSELPKQVLTRIRALSRAGTVAEMDGSVAGAIAFALLGVAALILFSGLVVARTMTGTPFLLLAGALGILVPLCLLAFSCRRIAEHGFAFLQSLRRAKQEAPTTVPVVPADHLRGFRGLVRSSVQRCLLLCSLPVLIVIVGGLLLGTDLLSAMLSIAFVIMWLTALLLREGASEFAHVSEALEERLGSGQSKETAALFLFLSTVFRDHWVPLLRISLLLMFLTALLARALFPATGVVF